ncbi:MAG: hypothetical protein FD171_1187 [Actinobacteria bacterium]|nr:MAG: hypothetical protein FD171_1187 [Actinomycetota bacterium]MDO8949728.1 hypothetical protein [Actinomycetota bacterium]
MNDADSGTPREGSRAVLNVFGLTLEVSNPRLAELLTMDARDALVTDVRELTLRSDNPAPTAAEVAEAIPGVVVSTPTPHDEDIIRMRREFRVRVEGVGKALGFETHGDGLWVSPTGVHVLTRAVDRQLSLAAASHFVGEMNQLLESRDDRNETSVLFVVDDQQTADVFKVAIRQSRLHSQMRTASIENLEEMRAMIHRGALHHKQAVVLLTPVANIDVGEIISVLNAQDVRNDSPLDVF